MCENYSQFLGQARRSVQPRSDHLQSVTVRHQKDTVLGAKLAKFLYATNAGNATAKNQVTHAKWSIIIAVQTVQTCRAMTNEGQPPIY